MNMYIVKIGIVLFTKSMITSEIDENDYILLCLFNYMYITHFIVIIDTYLGYKIIQFINGQKA